MENRRQQTPETCPDPVRDHEAPRSLYLVGKRPPLSDLPFLWRLLARFIYNRIGWSPAYGIEYMGIYQDEAEARHAASAPGFFFMELPFNSSLPEGSCQFGSHDFPHSEASPEYRKRSLPYTAVPTYQLRLLRDKIDGMESCLVGECSEVRG